jgi:aspartate kinase
VPSTAFDSWDLGLRTTAEFGGGAEVLAKSYAAIKAAANEAAIAHAVASTLEKEEEVTSQRGGVGIVTAAGSTAAAAGAPFVAVVTGFIAHDEYGHVTTLGRGGSDLTAAVLGAACGLDEIQVWKDVDGMLTADPRVVRTAVPVPSVTFAEASELAYFGAKILHPISMQPAAAFNIPVRIKNSYNPTHPGTVIKAVVDDRDQDHLVTAITTKSHQTVIDITSTRMLGQHGFLAQVFRIFEQYRLSVDVVATSEISISLTLCSSSTSDRRDAMCAAVDEMTRPTKTIARRTGALPWTPPGAEISGMAEVVVKEGRSIISLIANVERSSDVMAGVFTVLAREKVHVEMMSQGASKVNISLIVKDGDLQPALTALHDHFFGFEVA